MASARLEMLAASIDENDESHFRFLVDHRSFKYITIDVGLYDVDDMAFAPVLLTLLPVFPPGDWNVGRISKNPENGQPFFSETTRESLPGIRHTWHDTFTDYIDLTMVERLRPNVWQVKSPQCKSTIIAKFAVFLWEIPYFEAETVAYQWIDGKNIGPRFLGHLTEEGRVIGFLVEEVPNARRSNPDDLSLCQEALARLHSLGIRHGDVNRHNILICDGRATLIDFEGVQKCGDKDVLKQEFDSLPEHLMDDSGRGGVVVMSDCS
ncbi:MAG: hypothetical protein Q9163_005255 [Psora crenata]